MQYQRGSIGLFFRGDPTLKGWWSFENGRPQDKTGQGFNGTITTTGTATYAYVPQNDKILKNYTGLKLKMSGAQNSSNNYTLIRYTTSDVFNITGPLTLMVWYERVDDKLNTLLGRFNTITSSPYYHYVLSGSSANKSLYGGLTLNGTFSSYQSPDGVITDDGLFHLYAMTWDGSKITLYKDNQIVYQASTSGTLSSFSGWGISQGIPYYDGGNYGSNGYFGDSAIFSRALSPQEIAQYYRWATGKINPLFYYDPTSTSTSTSALVSQLEKTLTSTTAFTSLLEGKNIDTVSILTELQHQGYSTAAIQSLLEGVQQGDVALISELQRVIQDTLAQI